MTPAQKIKGSYSICTKIDRHLCKVYTEENEKRAKAKEESKEPPRFHPSSIGKCSRAIAMGMLGYECIPPDAHALRIFANGDSMHTRYQQWLAEIGILVAAEFSIKNDKLRISARPDALVSVDHMEADTPIAIAELKSMNAKGFARLVQTNTPKEEHVMQLQLYMHLTGIHLGVIIVENKDTQDLWEYWTDYDPAMANKLVEKIMMVNVCVDEGMLPDREYEQTSFQCRYCDYREICWN